LEGLDDDVDIKKALATISNDIKISARESLGCYELKQHKPWFYEGCLKLLDQIIQTKLLSVTHTFIFASLPPCFFY
jgi:hypothetical protein